MTGYAKRVTVTVLRELEIDFDVGLHEGASPTLTDQGEPAEAWIESAIDGDGNPIEYTEAEAEEAVKLAWELVDEPPDEPDDEPEDEQYKPF